MRITIDTDEKTLTVGTDTTYSLFSGDAFRVLSRQWLKIGWSLGHWETFSWMGRQLLQFPDDVLRLAEAIWLVQPDVILETGVYDGGSASLFLTLCGAMGRGRVIAVEKEVRPAVRDLAITLIEGDSGAPETAARVRGLIRPGERVFVFLDSDHSARHVARELANYAPLVTRGSYLVVADSNLPELSDTPQGDPNWAYDHPLAAVDEFLAEHSEFVRERSTPLFASQNDFGDLSYFARSWLKRLRATP